MAQRVELKAKASFPCFIYIYIYIYIYINNFKTYDINS